ncbi:transposase [Saccharopolyspora sp. ASAGF58]|uniref:transposase n=1 Tax=Saccharopolyspora sp. ASAGF58 TaxID=2719023 RepID=UPI001B313264|nr:transposase [Saccharopolyspora sp. ASAGF58]
MLELAVRRADGIYLDHLWAHQERPLRLLPDALKTLREHRRGESDLIQRDGVFYLVATCEVPEAGQFEPERFIGVDLGIANIATTSTGYRAAGRGLNRYRKRQLELRRKLQAKGTKSAKRLLKKRTGANSATPPTRIISSPRRS